MRVVLYYFTGTGNSLAVTKNIASYFDKPEIRYIPYEIQKEKIIPDSDVVGIIYPVYMCGLPLIVKSFAEKIRVKEKTFVFSFCNYAGMMGVANAILAKILNKNNVKLNAGFSVKMPGNYTPLYGAISVKRQIRLIDNMKIKIANLMNIVKTKSQYKIKTTFKPIDFLFEIFYKISSSKIKKLDEKFIVENNCIACGLCSNICPVNNIVMKNFKPVWKNNCEQCMACLQWCPVEAIQFTRITKGRKRYKFPNAIILDKKVSL